MNNIQISHVQSNVIAQFPVAFHLLETFVQLCFSVSDCAFMVICLPL